MIIIESPPTPASARLTPEDAEQLRRAAVWVRPIIRSGTGLDYDEIHNLYHLIQLAEKIAAKGEHA